MSARKTKCRYCRFLSDEIMPAPGGNCLMHSCHRFLDDDFKGEWHILSQSEMKRGCRKYQLDRVFHPELIDTELDEQYKPGVKPSWMTRLINGE